MSIDGSAASVVARLRQAIAEGRYAAGTRMAEIPVAEDLGVSRTPVRLAFRTLEQEGLLQRVGKRGLLVREFSDADVVCAVEVRGVLEGLAARRLAEQGMASEVRARLTDCLAQGEALLSKGHVTEADLDAWLRVNAVFHDTLVEGTDSRVIAEAIARNDHLPFGSASAITVDHSALGLAFKRLQLAQLQHRLVFSALERRESARVEMLMREHAYIGLRYDDLLEPEAGDAAGP